MPVPTGVRATATPVPATATAVPVASATVDKKSPLSKGKKNQVEPSTRTCGMAHIVTPWTDTRSNDRISVAMILPSGIDPARRRDMQIQVSDDGLWLIVKVRVDTGLLNAYQCYHSYLTKQPHNVNPHALDYHGKVCSHKKIVSEMMEAVSGNDFWDDHHIYLGRVCRRTLAGAGDGDTIFYGSTGVAPRKNGTRIFHVELIVESVARRLTKRHKVGTSVNWYKHSETNGDTMDVAEEEHDKELDREYDDDEDGSEGDNETTTDENDG